MIGQAVTFADMAASAESMSKFVRGSLTLIEGKYDLSDIMPFISTGGQQSVKVPRPNPDAIGGVFYRNANGQYTWTRSSFENFTEDTAELTYSFKIDSSENEDPSFSVIKPSQGQMDTLAEQFTAELLDSMVNGNPDLSVNKGPNAAPYKRLPGVLYRLRNGLNGIDTTMYQPSATFKDGTNFIDISGVGTTDSNYLVTMINQYILTMKPDIIMSNFLLGARVQAQLKLGAFLRVDRDAYGRTLGDWNGTRWIFPSTNQSVRQQWTFGDTTNWIMGYEDVNGNRTNTATATNRYGSILFMRCNTTDGFCGFNVTGMKPRGPEKLQLPDEGVGYGMRYGHGWGTLGLRCIGGVYGIKFG